MCNGQSNALPNTHSTITATLALGTSGVVLIPSATTSSSLNPSTMSSMTTSTGVTSTVMTITSSPYRTTATATGSLTTFSATQKSSTTPGLKKNQIVGISVGAVGGTAIVVGVMILLLCLRRRRFAKRGSDYLPFQADPAAPQMYGGVQDASRKQVKEWWGNTPPPVPPRLEISPPNMFSRRTIIMDNIGLAVSPERSDPVIQRYSKLLPEKPTLMPSQSLPSSQLQMERRQTPSTQSAITQFEGEDGPLVGQSEKELYGQDKNTQTTIDAFPSVPRDRSIGQFAPNNTLPNSSGNFNFRYMNQDLNTGRTLAPRLETYVEPLNVGRQAFGSFSRPRRQVQEGPQRGGLQVPDNFRPVTQSSSLYSQPTPHSLHSSFYNVPSARQPSLNISEANVPGYSRGPTSYQQVGPYDRASEGSFTSFESVDSVLGYKKLSIIVPSGAARKSATDLSPVAGSPASGKSPVSYPKIPAPVRLTAQTMKMVPPPPQPDFGSVFSSRSNQSTKLNNKPWRAAEIAAQQQRNLRKNDLRLSNATRHGAQLSRPDLLPAPQIRETLNTQPEPVYAMNYTKPLAKYSNTIALLTLPSQREGPVQSLPFRPQTPPRPQLNPQPQPQRQNPILRSGVFLRDHSPSNSTTSANSTSSSLLTKRLGANKAAALQITSKPDIPDKNKTGWRILKQNEIQAAKDPGWRPQLLQQIQGGETQGRSNNAPNDGNGNRRMESGGGNLSSKGVGFEGGPEHDDMDAERPPVTPGWVPKLTPTRRGDEMFLSVQ